jgi:SEC-C motif-containing protein
LHDGEAAATAEALMRSRYTAYTLGRTDYVFRTWHPRTRPGDLTTTPMTWLGLEVVRTEDGGPEDDTGVVEFVAIYQGARGLERLHEVSRFERRGGRWVYVDGDAS